MLLRIEGVSVFLLASMSFFFLRWDPLLYILLIAAPDLAMAGYIVNKRLGARLYNLFHVYVLPLLLIGTGIGIERTVVIQAGLAWAAHIGIDRAFQYGLKYDTGFRDTHMQRV